MKGILLAGGSGTRLRPLTSVVSKQILPVYNKPMVYYPLSVLMLAGIREILIISSPAHTENFRSLLGDGSDLGLTLDYAEQKEPNGIAEAFLIGADHIGTDDVALILGDNIFHGHGFSDLLRTTATHLDGCALFGYPVKDPWRYGVAELDADRRLTALAEKPHQPRSNIAVTGLYMYDHTVVQLAQDLIPSDRGELEITDINKAYLEQGRAHLAELGRGFVWLDMGTHDSLLEAGQYVQMLEQRQGIRIGCVEEVAYLMGYITAEQCHRLGRERTGTDYGDYLVNLAEEGGALSRTVGATCYPRTA
ncbi:MULTISPECIES: glucose-1-phosphate thymidylyltransferase RfbA [unclassified Streptomyces]|uniref:glucose-1-phosphate thymidylyltransferase RfbA n=1 Tax=unclassified Streptomyces TaxID=2593676 RepID=UPI000C26F7DB|nr:glucose-1-phosphate thymidylyltransferase RfbA [Streptomyces sp. CB02959]PJN33468.1 glucose-1-phosphate thymidylyltransferase [Streptomyces sp. CB02959]